MNIRGYLNIKYKKNEVNIIYYERYKAETFKLKYKVAALLRKLFSIVSRHV